VSSPAGRAAGPPRTQCHRRGQVADPACSGVAPRAQRATAAGAGDGARGQVGLDPVGHGDADHDTTGSRRGARCTSVVYQPPQRQGSTGVARRPARPNRRCSQAPGRDTATVTTRPSRIGEADAVLVTVAAPTKPNRRPARRHRRWRHTRSVVVTLDGAQQSATFVSWSVRWTRSVRVEESSSPPRGSRPAVGPRPARTAASN